MTDLRDGEFQAWIEEVLQAMLEEKVQGVSIAAFLEGGEVATNCYKLNVAEMRACAHAILDDAMLLVIDANKGEEEEYEQ